MAQLLLLIKYLRDERKKLAEQAGIPIYAVLNNAQLSQIAVEKPKSISELSKIEGICFTHYSRICPYCNKLL